MVNSPTPYLTASVAKTTEAWRESVDNEKTPRPTQHYPVWPAPDH